MKAAHKKLLNELRAGGDLVKYWGYRSYYLSVDSFHRNVRASTVHEMRAAGLLDHLLRPKGDKCQS